MALTSPQEALVVEIEGQIKTIEDGIAEIQQVVSDSLAIRNVGGGHIFNLAIAMKPQLDALKTKLEELKASE